MITNSQPFGKKMSENRRGGIFLTHTVDQMLQANRIPPSMESTCDCQDMKSWQKTCMYHCTSK